MTFQLFLFVVYVQGTRAGVVENKSPIREYSCTAKNRQIRATICPQVFVKELGAF